MQANFRDNERTATSKTAQVSKPDPACGLPRNPHLGLRFLADFRRLLRYNKFWGEAAQKPCGSRALIRPDSAADLNLGPEVGNRSSPR